jgi:hypothetical protein
LFVSSASFSLANSFVHGPLLISLSVNAIVKGRDWNSQESVR